jgi:hypothetical protein
MPTKIKKKKKLLYLLGELVHNQYLFNDKK